MRISDWSSDVCSSDLSDGAQAHRTVAWSNDGMHSRRIGGTQARTQVMRIGHAIEDQQQGLLLFVFEHVQNLVGIGGKFPGLGQCDHALMTGTAPPAVQPVRRPLAPQIGTASGQERVSPYE